MSSEPLVSIIIPCYNAAAWLGATLESALAQTWPRVEVIVIDDGSRDESPVVAGRYQPKGVRLEIMVNAGAAAARNRGLALAQGDFFQFLDADDLLAPDKIERQMERLRAAGPGAVATGAWARFHSDPADARFVAEPLGRDLDPLDWLVCSWREHAMMATAAWLVPRPLAERAGPWDASLGRNPVDDMEYFSRVLLASQRVLFCPDARAYYRSLIPGSLSRQRSEENWAAIFASFQLTADRLLAREDSPRSRLAVATALQQLVFDSYPLAVGPGRKAEARIRQLGGTDLRPDTGPWRRPIQKLFGWKAAKRLHDFWHRKS